MCTQEAMAQQEQLWQDIKNMVVEYTRKDKERWIDYDRGISATYPLIVDYRGYRYLFINSPVALTLTGEDLFTYPVAANTWTVLPFPVGYRFVVAGQATIIYVKLRATDDIFALNANVSNFPTGFNVNNFPASFGITGITPSAGSLPIVGATNRAAIAAGAQALNVKATPGYVKGIIVTTAGTAALQIFDNALGNTSGVLLFQSPAAPALATYFPIEMPATLGISAQQPAGGAAWTLAYD